MLSGDLYERPLSHCLSNLLISFLARVSIIVLVSAEAFSHDLLHTHVGHRSTHLEVMGRLEPLVYNAATSADKICNRNYSNENQVNLVRVWSDRIAYLPLSPTLCETAERLQR